GRPRPCARSWLRSSLLGAGPSRPCPGRGCGFVLTTVEEGRIRQKGRRFSGAGRGVQRLECRERGGALGPVEPTCVNSRCAESWRGSTRAVVPAPPVQP